MAEHDDHRIGERIARFRQEKGLSASELAQRSGVSKSYLSELEAGQGRRPSADTLYAIGSTLGVAMSDLLGRPIITAPPTEPSPELLAFARQAHLPQADVRMLAGIQFRGEAPRTPERWAFIYQAIRNSAAMDTPVVALGVGDNQPGDAYDRACRERDYGGSDNPAAYAPLVQPPNKAAIIWRNEAERYAAVIDWLRANNPRALELCPYKAPSTGGSVMTDWHNAAKYVVRNGDGTYIESANSIPELRRKLERLDESESGASSDQGDAEGGLAGGHS